MYNYKSVYSFSVKNDGQVGQSASGLEEFNKLCPFTITKPKIIEK